MKRMHDESLAPPDGLDATTARFEALRAAFAASPDPDYATRRATLLRLRGALKRHATECAEAAAADFGVRAVEETLLVDLLPSLLHIDHLLGHLRRWMRPSPRRPEWLFLGNRAMVRYQPKGVVGIVVPWNFPFYLALGPLATALAAGNRCMVKPSEYAPESSRALRRLLADALDEDLAAVVEGDAECARRFCALPFDHLVFTGSPAVGRQVMRAAADNLTPVTLELGGKSPALVSRSGNLQRAATRIVHGKTVNAGQICVAPDHALVPRERIGEFAEAAARAFDRLVGEGADYTSMVDERGRARMLELVADARRLGATVTVCGPCGLGDRQLPLHIITGVDRRMRVAREEIFGPLLPVIGYDSFDEALAHVRNGQRPLALYWFGTDAAERTRVLRETHSGGVTLNDWGWHAMNHSLPFGGTGTSGMGNYHGEEGFRELSHAKAVFSEHRWFPIELFHPPYARAVQRMLLRLYFGARS